MPTVLLTGFEPFAGEAVNPSAEIARALDGREIEGHRVVSVVLPCLFGRSIEVLVAELERTSPALVVCTGQAGGRPGVAVERVAINVDDARIPDSAGRQPIDEPVVAGGPAAHFSTLPLKSIVAALRRERIPSDVSQTAGTYVCNHVFYGLMHALRDRPAIRGGFVHVPFLPEQAARAGAGVPSLPLEPMIRAIEIVIATSLTTATDLRLSGGATH